MTEAGFHELIARWRAGDVAGAVALFTPDGVFWEAGKDPLRGRDAIAAHWKPFFESGLEWRMDVSEIFSDAAGERFVIGYTWEMKKSDGSWKGSPGCAVVHTAGGAIAQWREYKA